MPAALALAVGLAGDVRHPRLPMTRSGHRAIAYFDWDRYPELRAERFGQPANEVSQPLWVNPQDLQSAGLVLEDVCRSRRWYDLAFAQARRAGFDTLAWETYGTDAARLATGPGPAAVDALRRHGLSVTPLLDIEIGHTPVASLACEAYFAPHEESAETLGLTAAAWAANFPADVRRSEDGRPVAFVFSYGFPKGTSPETWDAFWRHARVCLAAALGGDPVVYWTRSETRGFLHALLHEGDWVRPFSFLAGGMQGPDCLTTSFWFDNAGAAIRDRITRVQRADPRMIPELRALLRVRAPRMVFHYALNEMLEGADLLPMNPEGSRRAALLRDLFRTREGRSSLPEVTVVVDDICHPRPGSPADQAWIEAERRFVMEDLPALLPIHRLVPGRRLAPVLAGGPVLVLALPSGHRASGGRIIDYGEHRDPARGGAFDASEVRLLMEDRWGLRSRPSYVFGRLEERLENATFTDTAGSVETASFAPLTFLPAEAGAFPAPGVPR